MHIANTDRIHLTDRPPTPDADRPVLLFDSGLGGLTVAAAVRRLMPGERLVYVGDTARVPYGSKSEDAIRTAATQLLRATLDRLAAEDDLPKHVIVACNSASAVAKQALREVAGPYGIGVTGMINPGVREACVAGGTRTRPAIGVIATEATIRSRAYDHALLRRRPRAHILLRPTPLLVPLVEEGRKPTDPIVRLALKQYLNPLIERAEELAGRLDALVLGCTHYPMLRDAIAKVVGDKTTIVDSAESAAKDLLQRLKAHNLLRQSSDAGAVRIMVTDVPAKFARLASRFLDEDVEMPELLVVDDDPMFVPDEADATQLRVA